MKPRLFRGPASAHEEPNEVIREFSAGKSGGLLMLTVAEEGGLIVDLYRMSGNIEVRVGTVVEEQGAARSALARQNLLENLRQLTTMDADARKLVVQLGRYLEHDERCLMTWQHEGECAIPEQA